MSPNYYTFADRIIANRAIAIEVLSALHSLYVFSLLFSKKVMELTFFTKKVCYFIIKI